MAHKKTHNRGQAVEGQVHGSGGATYYVTTDAAGVISCSCPSWLYKKKEAIEARVCKHLEAIFAGSARAGTVTKAKATGAAKPGKPAASQSGDVRKITFEEDEDS